jgi:hypothetical protein
VEIYQEIGRVTSFTPLHECGACRLNQMQGRVTMQTRGSRFVKVCQKLLGKLHDSES